MTKPDDAALIRLIVQVQRGKKLIRSRGFDGREEKIGVAFEVRKILDEGYPLPHPCDRAKVHAFAAASRSQADQ